MFLSIKKLLLIISLSLLLSACSNDNSRDPRLYSSGPNTAAVVTTRPVVTNPSSNSIDVFRPSSRIVAPSNRVIHPMHGRPTHHRPIHHQPIHHRSTHHHHNIHHRGHRF